MAFIYTLIASGSLAAPMAAANNVPEQNVTKPKVETITPYDAEPLLKQINGEAPLAESPALFFPAEAFQLVKGIKDPGAYHKQLLKWFDADITREKSRLAAGAPWSVDGFKLGYCKWKEKGSEANALPYWSCYKSKITLKNAKGAKENLDVRVLINWGTTWYVTHLGPIPKA